MLAAGCGGGDPAPDVTLTEEPATSEVFTSSAPETTAPGSSLMLAVGKVRIVGAQNNVFLDSDTRTCTGWNEYEGVGIGSQVIIGDSAGETVALGELGLPLMDDGENTSRVCEIIFEVRGVPRGEGFYSVAVEGYDPVQVAEDDMFGIEITLD